MRHSVRRIICVLLLAALFVLPAQADGLDNFEVIQSYTSGQYADVPPSNSFASNVKACYEYGIMQGYGDTFGLTNNVTRIASIIIACRIHSIYWNGENNIESSYSGSTSEKYLAYASENGIFHSFKDVTQPATRAEFARIMASALPEDALPAINDVENGAIPDVDSEENYANDVYLLYRSGILTGSDLKGTFYPDTNITRGAACAIASRLFLPTLRRSITLHAASQSAPAASGSTSTGNNVATPNQSSGNNSSSSSTAPSNSSSSNTSVTRTTGTGVIGNRNSQIYHEPWCDSVTKMKDSNKVYFDSAEQAVASHYKPCERCH